jgi:hypothetical protein
MIVCTEKEFAYSRKFKDKESSGTRISWVNSRECQWYWGERRGPPPLMLSDKDRV